MNAESAMRQVEASPEPRQRRAALGRRASAMAGLKSRSSEPGVMLWYQSTRFADAGSAASTAALHTE